MIQTNLVSNSARDISEKILGNLNPRLAKTEEKRVRPLDDELVKKN